ncbi:transmembrane signal receptor [Lithospermum erythrorhizon]|uniref:Transmembrane signal receptor n=1 Tax=Lithospermum erythrorhizon TaxID=34254 RepID=A0AAV3QMN9_LITER
MISMAQFFPLLLLLSISISFIPGIYSASNFTLMNNCSDTVWPGIFSSGTVPLPTSRFGLEKGESRVIEVPNSWAGRVWGRTNCSENSSGYFSCITGDCGSGRIACSSGSTNASTLVEFSLNGTNNMDFYDVSLLDGYNLPVIVSPQSECASIGCTSDLNGVCPSELQVVSSGGGVVACVSTCDAFDQDQYCCRGAYNSPSTCNPTSYSELFKDSCPTAYSYAYDDVNTTFSCPAGADYVILFCPFSINSTTSAARSPPPPPPPDSFTLPTTPRSPPPPAQGPTGSAGKGGFPATAVVAIVVASIFAIISFTYAFCFVRRKAKRKHNLTKEASGNVDENEILEAESLQYDLSYIKASTNDFSADNKIGQGGFGEVFKGTLNNGQLVAVKRLSKSSGQGEQEFKNEVQVVAKLQHRNLVRLLGYCLEKEEKILIYEYVPNESLDFILFDQNKQQSLDWSTRYKIIRGAARGILYLHEDSRLRIIHRDIKASNVLLDKDMNAKISDFGLARIVGFDESQGNTKRVVGTFGYMSPEYIAHGHYSVKSDVFSFGVLVLEIVSGKKNNRFYQSSEHLLSYAWKLWMEGKPLDLVDPALVDSFNRNDATRCIHMGLLCVQEDVNERPTMASVVLMLSSSSMTLPIPHQPAFFLQGAVIPVSNQSDPVESSANEVSISELYPR